MIKFLETSNERKFSQYDKEYPQTIIAYIILDSDILKISY